MEETIDGLAKEYCLSVVELNECFLVLSRKFKPDEAFAILKNIAVLCTSGPVVLRPRRVLTKFMVARMPHR